jgi:ATP-dependent helicase/nuclease subunit A
MADLKPNKNEYYSSYLGKYFSDKYIKECMESFTHYLQEYVKDLKNQTKRFDDLDMAKEISVSLESILSAENFDELIKSISQFSFPTKIRGISEDDGLLHKALKDSTKKFKEYSSLGSAYQVKERYLKTKSFVSLLISILVSLDKKLDEYKLQNNSYTFADVAKMAMELVKIPDINKELKNTIKHIMIDEYQDTNDLQEAFILELENKNLFMVGDIKQSIYRFRNANSEIFTEKYQRYSEGLDGKKIDMNTNFRSRREIVDGLNTFFSLIMSRKVGGVEYDENQKLKFGQSKYELEGNEAGNRNLSVLRYTDDGNQKNEVEAKIIAIDIINKINQGFLVLDNETGKTRSASFNDFAILIDRKTNFESFRQTFYDYGIPLQVSMEQELHNSDLMRVMRNIITLVANYNNKDFIKAFSHEIVSILRSFVYATADQKIYDLLKNYEELKKHELFSKLEKLNKLSSNLSLSKIVFEINMVFNLEESSIRIGDVRKFSSQLEHLYHTSETMEKLGYTINDLVTYFDDSEVYEEKITLGEENKQTSAVQLMSIHKAKGLEFPIVYYPGFDSDFNNPETKIKLTANYSFGILLPNVDSENPNTLFHYLASRKIADESLSEEVRKLYVALTRAKEQIIIIHRDEKERTLVSLSNAKSFGDFVRYAHLPETYGQLAALEKVELIKKNQSVLIENVEFGSLNLPFEELKVSRPSKTLQINVNEEILKLGTHLHYLMQLIDFKTGDTSFIKDKNEREKVSQVLKLPLFLDSPKATAIKEYKYFDSESKNYGIIDLVLVYENEWHIIDYKTSNIDDQNYELQLNAYANYLSTITNKPLRLFLVGIEKPLVREITFRRKI